MAKFQKTTPREDTTEKRPVTAEDIRFLRELQGILNTQDTMGNSDPRFWVIKQSATYDTTAEHADDIELIDEDGNRLRSLKDVQKYINDKHGADYYAAIRDGELELYEYIESTSQNPDGTFFRDSWTGFSELVEFGDLSMEPFSFLTPHCTRTVSEVVPDTFFLTHKDCEDHLRKYHYNYKPDAHAYAMTAVRSPRFENLIKMLQTIDWDSLGVTE